MHPLFNKNVNIMDQGRKYTPSEGENYKDFLCRVLANQADDDQLCIVCVLMEIIDAELQDRHYHLSATTDSDGLTLTIVHGGHPIDGRIVSVIKKSTDEVDYRHDSQGHHTMVIQRPKQI